MIVYNGSKPINIENPNICPHCHVVNAPQEKWYIFSLDTDNSHTFITAWQCSNQPCSKIFLALYKNIESKFIFSRFLNGLPKGPIWPHPIIELKSGRTKDTLESENSKFIKTYLQSL